MITSADVRKAVLEGPDGSGFEARVKAYAGDNLAAFLKSTFAKGARSFTAADGSKGYACWTARGIRVEDFFHKQESQSVTWTQAAAMVRVAKQAELFS